MTTLVVGASGATGKQLVAFLLNLGQKVKVVVRSPDELPESWKDHISVSIINARIADITEDEIADHLQDCQAIASCLGPLTLTGPALEPRKVLYLTPKSTASPAFLPM